MTEKRKSVPESIRETRALSAAHLPLVINLTIALPIASPTFM